MTAMRKTRLLIAVALMAGVAGCHNFGQHLRNHADVAAVKQALVTGEASWNQAFHAKNLDGLVAPYASDAVFVLPGLPAQVGAAVVREQHTNVP